MTKPSPYSSATQIFLTSDEGRVLLFPLPVSAAERVLVREGGGEEEGPVVDSHLSYNMLCLFPLLLINYPSIHSPTHPSITHPSTHPPIYPFIHPSVY